MPLSLVPCPEDPRAVFRFEKLDVWQKAIEFADNIYSATKGFPVEERFGLTSQLRRAAVSVSSNIAEGSGRPSDKEFARFLEIAYGSTMEVVSQARIATRQGFLEEKSARGIDRRAEQLARRFSGLRAKLLASAPQTGDR